MTGGRLIGRGADDRGAGTIAVLGLAAAVVGLGALLAPVAGVAVARHRAAAAADAAALAAAAVVAGVETGLGGEPCTAADAVAVRHGAGVVSCELDGLVVTIQARVDLAFGRLTAVATAGPGT